MSDDILPFAEGFAPSTPDAWRSLAEAALRGAPLERLTRTTIDGVARGPLFTREDAPDPAAMGAPGRAPFIRGAEAVRDPFLPWQIRQSISVADPVQANAQILEALSGGASEIRLHLDPRGEKGVAVRTLDELNTALDGVLLDLAAIHLAPSRMGPQYAALMVTALEQSGHDPDVLNGGLGLSPIGQKSMAGGGQHKLEERLERTAEAARYAADRLPRLRTVSITASAAHEAGGSEAQELAFLCAGATSYMRAFIDAGLSADQAAGALEFTLSADADTHLTIAKLRAARRVWARIAEAFGVSQDRRAMALHVITSGRMLSAQDPYTNLIRNACAGFAAAVGGADAVTTRPFTDAIGAPTEFARRVSRNLQILLMEESHLGRVADPAGGGFLHETLADRLAEAGWALFQNIERRGGLFETVRTGWLQTEISTARDKRIAALASGKEALIGVSHYPELDPALTGADVETGEADYAPPELDAPVMKAQAFPDKVAAAGAGAQVRALATPQMEWTPLSPVRLAEPFEALRDRAGACAKPPTAFLATIGPVAAFNARAGFASNRLAVAGIRALPAEAHDDAQACAAAFSESGARFVILCGSDDAYHEHASAYAAALKQAGAALIWLAGRPGDHETVWRAAGIDHFIHTRSDALNELDAALTALGG
ncbi:MAG: methylmalonyl-CoA mutase family protein [Pseudomonadota bacterium]